MFCHQTDAQTSTNVCLNPPSMINVLVLSLLFWKLGPSCVLCRLSHSCFQKMFSLFCSFTSGKQLFYFVPNGEGFQDVSWSELESEKPLILCTAAGGWMTTRRWTECFGQHTTWKVKDWTWHLRYLSPHRLLSTAVVQPVWAVQMEEIWVQIRSSDMFNRVTDPQETASKRWKTGSLFMFTSCFGLTFASSKSLKSESLLIFVSYICC